MFVIFALLSAVFSSLTALFSKLSLKQIKPQTAVFFRTGLILIFLWAFVFLTDALDIKTINATNLVFLVLSGACTGLSWISYFKALSIGDVMKVSAVDKSSVCLTVIIGIIFLNESFTVFKIIGVVAILLGTYCMIDNKSTISKRTSFAYFPFAALSAIFAALTSIFAKIGLKDVNSDLATAIRTCIVFVIAGLFALIIDVYKPRAQLKKTNNRANATTQDDNFSTPPNKVNLNTDDQSNILALSKYVPRNKHKIIIEIIFLILSAITTTFAWLMYYRALSMGEASVVAPIDKLSIAFTILLSWIFLKEKLVKKSLWGILFLTLGSISVIF